jgi:hypothetical protein
MASVLKVDQLQLSDGSTPTAGDLGIDTSGTVLQIVSSNQAQNLVTASTSYIDVGMTPVTITLSKNHSTVHFALAGGRLVGNQSTAVADGIAFLVYYSVNGGSYTPVPTVDALGLHSFWYANQNVELQAPHSLAFTHPTSLSAGTSVSYKVYARSWGGSSCRPFANDGAGGQYNVTLTEISA